MSAQRSAILCVANWDSDVGYAWWLMESFWVKIAENYDDNFDVILTYPSISKVPVLVEQSPLKVVKSDFTFNSFSSFFHQLYFLKKNKVKYIYFSDRANIHWRYIFYRLIGVKKIIAHDHTPGLRSKPSGLKCVIKKSLNRLPFISTDGSIGATEFVKQRLIDINCIPEKRCFSAPNGLPQISSNTNDLFNLLESFDIPKDAKVVVSVGRANLYKGVDFALRVIKELVDKFNYKDIHFLYLGDGPHLDKLRQLAKDFNISKQVTLPGRVSGIEKILSACHMAFHPSKGEVGYSLSILEYMQAGLPVVVSDNLSVCEATTDGVDGVIYQQGDVLSAAKALKLLLDDPERTKTMGESASLKIKEKYSLSRCHKALVEAIEYIIGPVD